MNKTDKELYFWELLDPDTGKLIDHELIIGNGIKALSDVISIFKNRNTDRFNLGYEENDYLYYKLNKTFYF